MEITKKTLAEILESATAGQIRSWFDSILLDRWPDDMPIPLEATNAIWHKLQNAYIELPLLPLKKEEPKKDAPVEAV
jgi:hypothetical protein